MAKRRQREKLEKLEKDARVILVCSRYLETLVHDQQHKRASNNDRYRRWPLKYAQSVYVKFAAALETLLRKICFKVS